MWSVMWRPRVMNVVSAVSVATFGAMCRRERVHVKIGGLRRTSGAIELRARVTRSQRLHDGQCRDEDTAKRHLAQLPGRLQHHAECSGDGTAHRAPSFRLEPNTHIPAAAGVADEVHGSPAAVLWRSICWVLALGPPWRGKKISGGPPGPFLLFDSGSSIRISRVVEVLALAFNYGLAKPIADVY